MKHDYTLFGRRIDATIVAGLLLAVILLVFFGWLAGEVIPGETMAFDMAARNAIHRHASAALTDAMWGITLLGSSAMLAPAGIVIFAVWLRGGRKRAAYLFAIAMTGAIILDITLKEFYRRPRPSAAFFGYAVPSTYSFPSGHALVSVCFYGTLVALGVRRHRWAAWMGAAAVVGLIGFSRIYLGVHYLTDVIGGYTAASVWLLTVRSAARMGRVRPAGS